MNSTHRRSSKHTKPNFHLHEEVETGDNSSGLEYIFPFPSSSPPSPILLSNGKPLKSSLKSSSTPSLSDSIHPTHLRTRSAPAAPHPTLKTVHFAEEKDGLESIRVFSRSADPSSTESDDNRYRPNSFPFPRIPPTSTAPTFHLDHTTSTIPVPSPSPNANIFLESLALSSSMESTLVLTGFLIVRNIAYEKVVAVRFTVDEWQTTSEVLARHVVTLPSLPHAIVPDAVVRAGKGANSMWDRFGFTIRLEDYAFQLQDKVMWLVARYTTADGEWWDNNEGCDYRVGFEADSKGGRKRAVTPAHGAPPGILPKLNIPFHLPRAPSTVITAASKNTTRFGKINLINYPSPSLLSTPTHGQGQMITRPPTREAHRKLASFGGTLHRPWRVGAEMYAGTTDSLGKDAGAAMQFSNGRGVALYEEEESPSSESESLSSSSSSSSSVSVPLLSLPCPASISVSALTSSGDSPGSTQQYTYPSHPVQSSSLPHTLQPQPSPPPPSLTCPPAPTTGSPRRPFLTLPKYAPVPMATAGSRETQRPEGGVADSNSDSVYKAFVQQWCFEESPPAAAAAVSWRELVAG